MASNVKTYKCPSCGANVDIDLDSGEGVCDYCGSKIVRSNDNEFTINYKVTDEAEIKKQTTELERIKLANKDHEYKKKRTLVKVVISFVLLLIGVFMIIFGFFNGERTGNPNSSYYMVGLLGMFFIMGAAYIWIFDSSNKNSVDNGTNAIVPNSLGSYRNKSYIFVEKTLKSAGFENVVSVALNDLMFGVIKKPNNVENITVDGQEIEVGRRYRKDAAIIISYHSYSNR